MEHFPLAESRAYTPEPCTFEDYRDLCRVLGIDRAVIVQPTAYATDNRATLDAIARANGRLRGVAVIDEHATDADLERLASRGVRGIRLTSARSPRFEVAALVRAARRIASIGWHVQLHFGSSSDLLGLADAIKGSPAPIVLDHLAGCRGDEGSAAPAFRLLLSLLRDHEHVWVKLSSFYRRSGQPAPYSNMRPLVHAVVEARPDRIVFGTNWPHTSLTGAVPNDGDLLDIVMQWIDDSALRDAIFVRNPEALYGFPPWRAE